MANVTLWPALRVNNVTPARRRTSRPTSRESDDVARLDPPTPTLGAMTTGLPLTGERTVPGIAREQYWFARHEVVYEWLAPRTTGQTVLEAGSGEGYGAAILRAAGARVIALDYDETAIRHSAVTYDLPHVRANLAALPVRAVDALVSLQVIEHLWDLRGFLAEVRRVADWTCLSTPNRLTFSPGLGRGDKPTNPFHVEEFDTEQLVRLVREAGFSQVDLYGVFHGARLAARPTLIAEQIDAAIGDHWPDELQTFVASVATSDFTIGASRLDDSLDLVVVAS